MTAADFRKELVRIMPGYSWTVHRESRLRLPTDVPGEYLDATGIITAGFNRLSTLMVIRRERDGKIEYEVKSAGFGLRSPWLSTCTRPTLARALRDLQNHYESVASNYSSHAFYLRNARQKKEPKS